MHELYELKEKLMDTLEEYAKKDMTGNNLEIVDKLTHTIKNLCKILEDSEESEYSNRDGRMYNGRYSRTGMSYADRRDSRGRYSSDDGMIRELRDISRNVPDNKTRMEIDSLIRRMENM